MLTFRGVQATAPFLATKWWGFILGQIHKEHLLHSKWPFFTRPFVGYFHLLTFTNLKKMNWQIFPSPARVSDEIQKISPDRSPQQCFCQHPVERGKHRYVGTRQGGPNHLPWTKGLTTTYTHPKDGPFMKNKFELYFSYYTYIYM